MLLMAGCRTPSPTASVPVPRVAPRQEDVASIDGLMRPFYEVVNVAPEEPRQWSRDRTLYSPWIRFVATGTSPTTGRTRAEAWDHQRLVDESEPLLRKGFREREIHRSLHRYGNIAHVDSTYETTFGTGAQVEVSRGVNSVELYFDGTRWWIASVMWMSEDEGHPIPAEYLPTAAP